MISPYDGVHWATMANEVEIKFVIHDLEGVRHRLHQIGFREQTPRTHELNTLYDHLGKLRGRGEVLRIRKYGDAWKVTHKSKGRDAKHKTRAELETGVADGPTLDKIFQAIGYEPRFVYEKFRSEWTDGNGHVVLDETPIGIIGEIEGTPEWIDRVAEQLGVQESDYINKSYAELFAEWTKRNRSKAKNMTFGEISS
jgi:adenylate cyclase class 2